MNFKIWLESVSIMKTIERLTRECDALPDTDNDADLFGEKNYKQIMLPFYTTLLKNLDKPELVRRLEAADLSGPAYAVYRRINAGGHPVRDFLILQANNLNRMEK